MGLGIIFSFAPFIASLSLHEDQLETFAENLCGYCLLSEDPTASLHILLVTV